MSSTGRELWMARRYGDKGRSLRSAIADDPVGDSLEWVVSSIVGNRVRAMMSFDLDGETISVMAAGMFQVFYATSAPERWPEIDAAIHNAMRTAKEISEHKEAPDV